jgi:magnesium chelatase subunit I
MNANISIKTLGQLKESGYRPRSIKEELRTNLIANIREGKASFTGIHGYDQSVIPQLERAILSQREHRHSRLVA